ncbi:hypothetical protein [Lysobacter enzymogenes]|uniref:hypothetical protein n=1 Tax=Lysobacter enzymogenes TaxID=69 RepID=UPI001A97743B|nr:hypothetical protein [Lysobacter enzymogenes]QQP97170.1 hypothetical protein JHW38_03725 [Lysobacter enzymogenes]
MFKVAALCALAALPLAQARGAPSYYEGLAFSPQDGRLLYRESHWTRRAGGSVEKIALFRCPDGRAFARRILDEGRGAAAPDFAFEDARDGYREGLRSRAGQRIVYSRPPRESERSATIQVPQGAVADAGFDARIGEIWPQLAAGKTVSVPFLIPSRLAFYRFRAEPEAPRPGARAELRVRLRMDAWYAFAAPEIELVYDAASRRLKSFSGLSTIRDDAGRYRKVLVRFPPDAAAPDMDAQAAATAPLTQRCGA